LDNANSFDALASQLPGVHLIAVDLPGHGLSGHRAASGTYNIWDDLPDLSVLISTLGLERFGLIGHSRGAMIATLLAAVEGERVSRLVLLDGLAAPPFEAAQLPDQLRRFVHDYGNRQVGAARVYDSVESAISARCKATGINREAALQLVPRSLQSNGEGSVWRNDPRLRYASALKLSGEQCRELITQIHASTLLILAQQGNGPLIAKLPYLEAFRQLTTKTVDGCHHCHMLAESTEIAGAIRDHLNASQPS